MLTKGFTFGLHGFIEYRPTPADIVLMRSEYERRYASNQRLNSKTVYGTKEGNLAGILGEIVFGHFAFGIADKCPVDNSPFDFTLLPNNKTIDVKCKLRNVLPKPHFEASHFSYQTGFDVDYYAFMSTIPDWSTVWLCGWITKEEFNNGKHSVLWKAGTTDRSNGMTFRKDTISVAYMYLNSLSTLLTLDSQHQ